MPHTPADADPPFGASAPDEHPEPSTTGSSILEPDAPVEVRNQERRRALENVHEPEESPGEDRSVVLGEGLRSLSRWCLRVAIIIVTVWLLGKALAPFWVILLPLILGLIISTVLWPPAAFLRRRGFSPPLAALSSVLGALALFGGVITAIVPTVVDQVPELTKKSTQGVNQVQTWLQGPPLRIPHAQINNAVDVINAKIQKSGETIAAGAFAGVTTVGSVLVTLVLSLILSFFFIKDGDRFLPWLRLVAGERNGAHLTEVLTRAWHTLSGFIRTQAIVSLIDSVCIGAGLVFLGIPLALPLCVITFFGGFIPIIGATVAGALAVLVALVTHGMTTALIVLGIVVLVQQVEGHILQPLLQSRSMSLHPVLVLLGIAAGSEEHGVIGGFLAVPVVATLAVLFRYIGEQVDLRSGTITADDLQYKTERGRTAALRTERLRRLRQRNAAAAEGAAQAESRETVGHDGSSAELARSVSEHDDSVTHQMTRVVGSVRERLHRHHDED